MSVSFIRVRNIYPRESVTQSGDARQAGVMGESLTDRSRNQPVCRTRPVCLLPSGAVDEKCSEPLLRRRTGEGTVWPV
jgi:hypothetical protein